MDIPAGFSSFSHVQRTMTERFERERIRMPHMVSLRQVRRLMIRAQGLDRERPVRTPTALLHSIERMGVLQIDTLSVVNRSHYFVLWSRHGAYPIEWLDGLLEKQQIFECWTHEACFAPNSWFPYHRRLIADGLGSTKTRWASAYLAQHRASADAMLEHMQKNGTVRANDFQRPIGQRKAWWDWTHEKQLLEALFACGEVMIARREGFQRVYVRTEAMRPEWNDGQLPSAHDTASYQILATVRSLGIVHTRWLGDYYRMKTKLHSHLNRMVAAGLLETVQIEGIDGEAYCLPEVAHAIATYARKTTHVTLLSPFDPLVWDRKRALDVFGFDYRIECYTPAHKRVYGYFTLPILVDDALIGRVDCKVDRKAGVFSLRALHFEAGYMLNPPDAKRLAMQFGACATWHGARIIEAPGIGTTENSIMLQHAFDDVAQLIGIDYNASNAI